MSDTEWQSESEASAVPARAKRDAETQGRDWSWVEARVWNERMLAALGNGVRGGKWFSLIDKVYRQETLKAAWDQVRENGGAAGVDGQSVKQFGLRAEIYLAELEQSLKSGEYRPEPIKRVEIPKIVAWRLYDSTTVDQRQLERYARLLFLSKGASAVPEFRRRVRPVTPRA